MVVGSEWVLLAYRLPREPSSTRVMVWRRLRGLGAVQLVDGLVGLPASSQNREQLDWLADEVLEAGGEAWTFTATPGSKDQQRALAARMTYAAAAEYRAVLAEAEALVAAAVRPSRRTVERLRRQLRRVQVRDPFPGKEGVRAQRAVARLAATLDVVDEEPVR
jgi:hypothetical protein